MIEVVSEQVLSEFASCLSERLGETGGPAEQGDEARGGAPIGETGNDATPANALGLVWRALKSWLGTLFGRR